MTTSYLSTSNGVLPMKVKIIDLTFGSQDPLTLRFAMSLISTKADPCDVLEKPVTE